MAGGPPEALLDRLGARWVPVTGSTNADLLVLGEAAAGRVLVADEQVAGRGRRGRTWTAPPGTSLILSIGVRPRLPLASWGLLPLAAGSALVATVRRVAPEVPVALKWPNDLLVLDAARGAGVKAAGILVEAAGPVAIVGVGVNTDWRGVPRPDGLVATSLSDAAGRPVDRWALLEALVPAVRAAVDEAGVDPGGVVRRYVPDCATLGCAVVAHRAPPVAGTAVGLTPDGHLRIRTADGRETAVAAGDVEHLRPDAVRPTHSDWEPPP